MYVGICEDNLQDMEALVHLLKIQDSPVPLQILQYTTLQQLEEGMQKPDVLFLDIEVGAKNSIEYFHQSNTLAAIPLIVLVSSFSYYITHAFNVPVFQFLLKPVQPEIFTNVFTACCKQYMQFQQYCEISSYQNEKQILQLRHIVYIKSEQRQLIYADIFDNRYTGTEGLQTTLNRLLPFGFCQIHKSYLVNLMFIISIAEKGVTVQLENKRICLPVGKKYLNTARQSYLKYLAVKGAN